MDLFSNFEFKEVNDNLLKDISNDHDGDQDIAVIGMSVKLPMADGLSQFWDICAEGIDCIKEFPSARKKDIDDYLEYINSPLKDYLKGAFLEEIDSFDYPFFNMSPKEASLMNPSQRLFLEKIWEAIENAGYDPRQLSGSKTGVFAGYIGDVEGYKYKQMVHDLEGGFNPIGVPGNLSSIIPSRISYLLDLRGPSMVIDTACSSTLVAVHMACESIRSNKCNMAIAGGVKLNFLPLDTNERVGIESSDGKTRSFDDSSDGTGIGEGIGVVILKPLRKALRDGDIIHGVIKGSAINQDGNSAGITAPKASSQTDLLIEAWMDADINPTEIGYIEAHGTGTKLGDPIEIEGITQAFRRYTQKKQFCAIGSVKSNLGHLYEASGIIGMIKCILAIKNHQLPPSNHFMKPNKKIKFEESPVYLNNRLLEWKEERFPRRAGVSSFGFSGTNCHLVLEEAPSVGGNHEESQSEFNILTLSAKSKTALAELIIRYKQFVIQNSSINIRDLSFTANIGRGHYPYRLALLIDSVEELQEKLEILSQMDEYTQTAQGIYFSSNLSFSEFLPMERSATPVQQKEIYENVVLGRTHSNIEISFDSYEVLCEICRLYIQGENVDWNVLYGKENRQRIELPTYPFDRLRCWPEVPSKSKVKLTGSEEEDSYSEIDLTTGLICAETLGFKEINVKQSLYSLGADSISMLKILNRLSAEFGISLSFQMLFNNPTVEHISRVIRSSLDENELELPIEKVTEQEYYEASSAQKRIFMMQQLDEESTVYNVNGAVEMIGYLDMNKLNDSFSKLIERHEVLRTTFALVDGKLVQKIHQPESVSFNVEYYQAEREQEIVEIAYQFIQPFQLENAPLFRVAYIELATDKSILLIDIHHIISDGSSLDIMTKEFADIYSGGILKPIKLQYKDYTAWHLTKKNTSIYRKQEQYWLNEFSGKLPVLNLHPDYVRPLSKDYKGACFQFKLDRDRTDSIKKLAQESDCTVFMVLLASIKILLAKQSGQDDLVVGTPITGRNHQDLESILGIMINTLAIRSSVNTEDTFRQYLKKIRKKTLKAYDNQDYQFEDLIENVQIDRNLSVNPLFDVMFVLHEIPTIKIEGIPSRPCELPKHTEMFDLSFVATEVDREIIFTLTYATSLFKEETIKTMVNKYKRILDAITMESEIKIKDIEFITNEEAAVYKEQSGLDNVIDADFFF
ncbi:condensation domain-containing protein [Bacillus atrophaeus]|uniref:condensation domain-containing protein n=1 Tax=Bacillus atrophaeus TaxID=1452 RepID=UPI00227FB5B4|nr:condensation domain-containing protein [Bacillus atrophaeus]MCY8823357.1 condensation domain-containing protein [Bacillus atrophaeus]MCY8841550.1 condensation domain-containing protein [Bacillus atrophaeus]MEC0805806.1 condensation domain-containing protein [Bacillus atrophaeus]MEC0853721.1 condensation domain-containing protein [Bacillus atrophaeus]MEC0856848.1 condensation domain-containing protein [Bacillus atrophaeus]